MRFADLPHGQRRRSARYAALAGRQLFSLLLIIASAAHFSPETIAAVAKHGVPLPGPLVPLSGIIALMERPQRPRWLSDVIFLVPVTVVMLNFWSVPDPVTFQLEKAMFMKDVTCLAVRC